MTITSATAQAAALNAVAALAPYVGANTATPTTATPSEVTGGTYARVAITWTTATASSPSISNTASISINIPASTTVTDVSEWSAATAGTFEFGQALTSSVAFASAGTLSIAVGALQETAS